MHSDPTMNTSSSIRILVIAFAPAVALLLGGCATKYHFTVDAVRDADLPPAERSYRLAPSAALARSAEMQALTEQVLVDVRTALSGRGFHEAPASQVPAMEIEVDFGKRGPLLRTSTRVEPVYLTASGVASRSQGPLGRGAGGSMIAREVGQRTVTTVAAVYAKFLRLTAWAGAERTDGRAYPEEFWSVLVTNEDESNELTHYTRLMAAAAMDVMGEDTAAPVEVVVTERDARVKFIALGISGPTPSVSDEVRHAKVRAGATS
jgi:hypothetical protein